MTSKGYVYTFIKNIQVYKSNEMDGDPCYGLIFLGTSKRCEPLNSAGKCHNKLFVKYYFIQIVPLQTPQDKAVTEQVLFSFMLHSKCQKVVTWNILLFKKMQKQEKLVYQNLKKLPPHLFLCQKVSPDCRLNSPLFIFNSFSNILYSYFFTLAS